jgi:hypothetical protein
VSVLLAVDQELGEGSALWVAPELSDGLDAVEDGSNQDVEHFGAAAFVVPDPRAGRKQYVPAGS